MAIVEAFINELTHEAASTRKVLERIPEKEFGWSPHPKSFTMGQLAAHVAEILGWAESTLMLDELDFDPAEFKPWMPSTTAEVVARFDENLQKGLAALRAANDDQMMVSWKLKLKGETKLDMPRVAVMRAWVMNHLIHHRAQLTVYLRMRDIPVPSIYGPSADEGQM